MFSCWFPNRQKPIWMFWQMLSCDGRGRGAIRPDSREAMSTLTLTFIRSIVIGRGGRITPNDDDHMSSGVGHKEWTKTPSRLWLLLLLPKKVLIIGSYQKTWGMTMRIMGVRHCVIHKSCSEMTSDHHMWHEGTQLLKDETNQIFVKYISWNHHFFIHHLMFHPFLPLTHHFLLFSLHIFFLYETHHRHAYLNHRN